MVGYIFAFIRFASTILSLWSISIEWEAIKHSHNIKQRFHPNPILSNIQLLILQPLLLFGIFVMFAIRIYQQNVSIQKVLSQGWHAGYKIFNKFVVYKNSVHIFLLYNLIKWENTKKASHFLVYRSFSNLNPDPLFAMRICFMCLMSNRKWNDNFLSDDAIHLNLWKFCGHNNNYTYHTGPLPPNVVILANERDTGCEWCSYIKSTTPTVAAAAKAAATTLCTKY